MNVTDAHHDITFACLAYLNSSFELIDDDVTEHQRAIRVAKSFHGLHLYANEYWLKHLYSYAEARSVSAARLSEPLVDQLVNLAAVHKSFYRVTSQELAQEVGCFTATIPDSIAPYLENNLDAKTLLQKVIRFNESLGNEKNRSGGGKYTFFPETVKL